MEQINEEELFRQLQARKPMAPREFYNKALSHLEFNLSCHAIKCVKLVLGEHRGTPENEAFVAQCIRWFGEDKCNFFLDGRPDPNKKLRLAVAEMIDKAKQGKSKEDGRQMCRKMAADMMRKVHGFTKWVNGDQDYWAIPAKLLEKMPDDKKCPINYLYDTKTLEAIGVDLSKVKKDYLLVSAAEKAWLREGMMYDSSSRESGLTPLKEYFQFFYDILKDIARFWAAQLLELGIDMQELERETGIEFEHHLLYYVDFIPNDERCDCCVYNPAEAKELLDKIKHGSNPPKALLKEEGRPTQNRTIVQNGSNSLYVENNIGSINIGFGMPPKMGVAGKGSEAYFNNIANQIVKDLGEARVSIHVAIAWFTNQRIADKLVEKFKEGLDVKVVYFKDHTNCKFGVDIDNIPFKAIRGTRGGTMHDKFCVIDNQKVITGSYNWSENAENKNDENAVVLYDNDSASDYSVEFRRLFEST